MTCPVLSSIPGLVGDDFFFVAKTGSDFHMTFFSLQFFGATILTPRAQTMKQKVESSDSSDGQPKYLLS